MAAGLLRDLLRAFRHDVRRRRKLGQAGKPLKRPHMRGRYRPAADNPELHWHTHAAQVTYAGESSGKPVAAGLGPRRPQPAPRRAVRKPSAGPRY